MARESLSRRGLLLPLKRHRTNDFVTISEKPQEKQHGDITGAVISRRRLLFPIKHNLANDSVVTSESHQENEHREKRYHWWNKFRFGRRPLLIVSGTALAVTSVATGVAVNVIKNAADGFNAAMEFLYNVPSEIRLLFEFPNLNEPIKLTRKQLRKGKLYCIGDSMNLDHGIRHDSKEGFQEFSHVQMVVDTINTRSKELHPDDPYVWEAVNLAVPGATTGNENPKGNDMLGIRQLGNPDVIRDMETFEGTLGLEASGNGNDFDEEVSTQAEAIQAKGLINNIRSISVREVDKKEGQYNDIKSQLGGNWDQIFSIGEKVNLVRLQNNLPPMYIIVILPASYRKFTVVPFAPKGSTDPMPHGITIGGNRNLQQAFYLITCGIFDELRNRLPKHTKKLKLSVVSKFGLEQPGKMLDKSGHFHERGQQGTGQAVLDVLQEIQADGSSSSLTDLGYVIPQQQVTELVKDAQGNLKFVPIAA